VRAARILLIALAFCLLGAVPAQGQPVLKLDRDGDVRRVDDPALPPADLPVPPAASTAKPGVKVARRGPAPRRKSFRARLAEMLSSGEIDELRHDRARNAYNVLKRAYKRARGTRKTNLRAVMREADDISRRGFLTATRVNAMTATLERNEEWWTEGSIPRSGQRIEFEDSEVVWQYYRGEGIQIQQLGNFGKANALWRSRRELALRSLLDELISYGADRGGALAFEYLFEFGGGEPPWTSGLSQATAVQALARASDRYGDPKYVSAASQGLGVFEKAPPDGVRIEGDAGPHYAIYTFSPDLRVINAFLQSIIGLYDYTRLTNDPRARALYEAGEAQARVETPLYNTGAWSLYSLERESDLSYHKLTRDFLRRLCQRLDTAVYCDTADAFTEQLSIDPEVAPVTRRVRGGKAAKLKFKLSKISRVGVTVLDAGGDKVFATSAVAGYGTRFFTWRNPPLKGGRYTLRVSAVDLAGNRGETTEGPLRVLRGKKRRRS
jgi:hypothetical protein